MKLSKTKKKPNSFSHMMSHFFLVHENLIMKQNPDVINDIIIPELNSIITTFTVE